MALLILTSMQKEILHVCDIELPDEKVVVLYGVAMFFDATGVAAHGIK